MSDDTPEPKSSSIIPEQEVQEQESSNEESVLKNEEVLSLPEDINDAGLQMENQILRQEIKYRWMKVYFGSQKVTGSTPI